MCLSLPLLFLFLSQSRRRIECPVSKFGHLTILTFKEEVLIRIVYHAVKVHLSLNHELREIQLGVARNSQATRNEILSSLVKPEPFYIARLISLALAPSISPEITLSRKFLVSTEVYNSTDSVAIVRDDKSCSGVRLCHSRCCRDCQQDEKKYLFH